MASSSGTSSGSTLPRSSGSEEDLQLVMDQKKRKRMQSNRESARRSRMRKQKHLDDLMAQVALLRNENSQILTRVSITTQHYLNVEGENSVLRTQMMELSNRLESLNEIISFMQGNTSNAFLEPQFHQENNGLMEPWNMVYLNQPIIASSANIFPY